MRRRLRRIWGFLTSLTQQDALDDRLREEMLLHEELLTEKHMRLGLSRAEASRQAHLAVGGVDQARELVREARGTGPVEDAARDLRYGIRQWRRTPGFAVAAILTIGLGIGATVAIFAAVDGVLLQPLPFRDPDRLVTIWEQPTAPGGALAVLQPDRKDRVAASVPVVVEWRGLTDVFESVAARHWRAARLALTGREEPEEILAGRVTANYFATLGVRPVLGRAFVEEDDAGAPKSVVLGHAVWQRRFGGRRDVIGQPVTMNGARLTVVGVMPASFPAMAGEEAWLVFPLAGLQGDGFRGRRNMEVVARLRKGVSIETARAALQAAAATRARLFPRWSEGMTTTAVPLHEDMVGDVRGRLLLLFAASVFVVLIACANLTNMMLARGIARRREMAVRAALGAGTGRLMRQILSETAVLAVVGGLAGLGIGLGVATVLAHVGGETVRDFLRTGANWRILAFAGGTSAIVGLLTALIPAWHASVTNVSLGLKPDSGGTGLGMSQRLSHALVAAELAVALVLLVGAGLMVTTLVRLSEVNLGFRSDGLLTFRLTLPPNRYRVGDDGWDSDGARRFLDQVLERIRATPGVRTVGAVYPLPFSGQQEGTDIAAEGSLTEVPTHYRIATPGYFQAMQAPLVMGRDFGPSDTEGAPPVVIVNETLARVLWPGRSPVGRRVQLKDTLRQVVGVAADCRHLRPDLPAGSEVYVPRSQVEGYDTMFVTVRTEGPPSGLAHAVQGAVWDVDRNQPIAELMTMDERLHDYLAVRRIYTLALGLFAGVALALAALGVYGVMSYWVSQRRREIGVRMALGARQRQVVAMILRRGLRVSMIGLVLGAVCARAVVHMLSSLLYGIEPTDGPLLVVATLCLGLVALTACYIPARRATRVDPLHVLRSE